MSSSEPEEDVQIYSSQEEDETTNDTLPALLSGDLVCPICLVPASSLLADASNELPWQIHLDNCRGVCKRSKLGDASPQDDPWLLQWGKNQKQMLVGTLISLDWKSRRKVACTCRALVDAVDTARATGECIATISLKFHISNERMHTFALDPVTLVLHRTASDCQTPRVDGHTVTVAEGKIYVIGGSGTCGLVKTIDVLDPITGRWTHIAFPIPQVGARSFANDGHIYIVGGKNMCLDIVSGTWRSWHGDQISTKVRQWSERQQEDAVSIMMDSDGKTLLIVGPQDVDRSLLGITGYDITTGQMCWFREPDPSLDCATLSRHKLSQSNVYKCVFVEQPSTKRSRECMIWSKKV